MSSPVFSLRVCNRALYFEWVLLCFGAILLVLSGVSLFGGSQGEAAMLAALGLALVIAMGGRIAYLKFSALYTVDGDAITARYGLVAHKTRQVRATHVRSVSVSQSLVGRLLGFGDLEFASAGTGDAEIVFRRIRNPNGMKKSVSQILGSASDD